jgi:valyl-tRNA synthetase
VSFLVGTAEYTVPMAMDVDKERADIAKELAYQEGFLASVRKKLENANFTAHAPAAVVEAEKRKEEDASSRINTLRQTLAGLE